MLLVNLTHLHTLANSTPFQQSLQLTDRDWTAIRIILNAIESDAAPFVREFHTTMTPMYPHRAMVFEPLLPSPFTSIVVFFGRPTHFTLKLSEKRESDSRCFEFSLSFMFVLEVSSYFSVYKRMTELALKATK